MYSFTALDQKNWERCLSLCQTIQGLDADSLLLVNVESQRMHLIANEKILCSYSISTGKNGVGQEEGSYKTPLGLHVIDGKYGEGADPYAIISKKQDSGRRASPNDGTDSIIARVFTLRGLEPQFNQGKNGAGVCVDSYERYIYIHGTSDLENLGKPASKGCLRMLPEDAIDLYEKISSNTVVFIYDRS